MTERSSVLTAAGHPVHRVRRAQAASNGETVQKPDGVALIERYTDLAAFMHKTVVVPRGDRFLVGCICGFTAMTPSGGSLKASILAQQHVEHMAVEMMENFEPKPVEAPEE